MDKSLVTTGIRSRRKRKRPQLSEGFKRRENKTGKTVSCRERPLTRPILTARQTERKHCSQAVMTPELKQNRETFSVTTRSRGGKKTHRSLQ